MAVPLLSYRFLNEPRGSDYDVLLDFCRRRCRGALLVVRPGLGLDDGAQSLLDRMSHHLIAVNKSATDWPGTSLLAGATATVFHIAFNDAVQALLSSAATGLYDWLQPALPEDLGLLRAGGEPLLGTIAHERDAFMNLSTAEWTALQSEAPAVAALLGLEART